MSRHRLACALAVALAACATAPAAVLAAPPGRVARLAAPPHHRGPLARAAQYGPARTAAGRVFAHGSLSCSGAEVGVSPQTLMASNNGATEYVGVTAWLYRWNGSAWGWTGGSSREAYASGWGSATISYESSWIYNSSTPAGGPGAYWNGLAHGYYEIVQRIEWFNGRTGALVDSTIDVVTGGAGGSYCTV